MECAWPLIPEPQEVALLETRTVRRFITWPQTFTVAEQAQLLTAITSTVTFLKLTKFLEMIKRELELHRLNTHKENRVQMAALRLCSHAFRYGGNIGTHLIVGGVDCRGPQLIETDSHGHSAFSPFHTTGSGSLAAMAIFESRYKEGMSKEEAI